MAVLYKSGERPYDIKKSVQVDGFVTKTRILDYLVTQGYKSVLIIDAGVQILKPPKQKLLGIK
jgi:hypothetical protein